MKCRHFFEHFIIVQTTFAFYIYIHMHVEKFVTSLMRKKLMKRNEIKKINDSSDIIMYKYRIIIDV